MVTSSRKEASGQSLGGSGWREESEVDMASVSVVGSGDAMAGRIRRVPANGQGGR